MRRTPTTSAQLDADAIAAVREEAWPRARNADEMHEALVALGAVGEPKRCRTRTGQRGSASSPRRPRDPARLAIDRRERGVWVAAERLAAGSRSSTPTADIATGDPAAAEYAAGFATPDEALRELLRARLGGLGPVTADDARASAAASPRADVERALVALQTEGSMLQGRFTPRHARRRRRVVRAAPARAHPPLHLKRLRREIEPVEPRDFVRFLFEWQHVGAASRVSGPEALAGVLAQLEGYEAPAALWEAEMLPARVKDYAPPWLDDLCTAGRTLWTRLRPVAGERAGRRQHLAALDADPAAAAARAPRSGPPRAGARRRRRRSARARSACRRVPRGARRLVLRRDRRRRSRLLRAELEDALAELVVRGRVNCDSFAGLRALLVPRGQARFGACAPAPRASRCSASRTRGAGR